MTDLSKFAGLGLGSKPASTQPQPESAVKVNPFAAKKQQLASQVASPAPAQTTTPVNAIPTPSIANTIAGLRATALEESAKKAEAERKALSTITTEVPADILTLHEDLQEIEGFPAEEIQQLLGKLYQALENDQADFPIFLEAINKNLRQYEELSYLLSDDQLKLYFKGLMQYTGVNIKTTAPKTSKANIIKQVDMEGGIQLGDLDLSSLSLALKL